MATVEQSRDKFIKALKEAYSSETLSHCATVTKAILERVLEDKESFYVGFSNDSPDMVSYAAKPEFKTNINKRTKTSFGRFVRRRLEMKDIPDHILGDITNFIMTGESPDDNIKVLRGDAVQNAYKNHTGDSSCMTGDSSILTAFYAKNPKKIGMAIATNTRGNSARAILWTTDAGVNILDRIYPSSSSAADMLRKWAKSNGYLMRTSSGIADGNVVKISDGKQHYITLVDTGYYPYFDTFCFADIYQGKIFLSNAREGMSAMIRNTNGKPTRLEYCICDDCGKYMYKNTERPLKLDNRYVCEACYRKEIVKCTKCRTDIKKSKSKEISGKHYCTDCVEKYNFSPCSSCGVVHEFSHKVNGSILCDPCFTKNYGYCEECGSFEERANIKTNKGDHICLSCYEQRKVRS